MTAAWGIRSAMMRSDCASCSSAISSRPAAPRRAALLADWPQALADFVKVVPSEYRRALAEMEPGLDAGCCGVGGDGQDHRHFWKSSGNDRGYEPARERTKHWREFIQPSAPEAAAAQASRCMDCGIPFCHSGCPVNNLIPDWNDLVYQQDWQAAIERLHQTNNFPEITGRVCPAPCEAACTLNIVDAPVTIKSIEGAIADRAWAEGWVSRSRARVAPESGSRSSAPVRPGSPAHSSSRALGTRPLCSRRSDRIGGLLRYGIPDFKLDKVDHRPPH